MKWFENYHSDTAADAEDLAYPPSGGRGKMALLGILLPIFIVYTGVQAWMTEEAVWFGRRGVDLVVRGRTAKAIGFVYGSIGLFCHFRWLWGLIPVYRVFEIGTTVSLFGILGGIGFAVYYGLIW